MFKDLDNYEARGVLESGPILYDALRRIARKIDNGGNTAPEMRDLLGEIFDIAQAASEKAEIRFVPRP